MVKALRIEPTCDHVEQVPAPAVAAFIGSQAVEHGLVCRPLQVEVERSVDPQPGLVHLICAQLSLELSPHLFDKPWRLGVRWRLQVQAKWLRSRSIGLGHGDLAIFEHSVDHLVAPAQRAVGIVDRRVLCRPLGQPCQQRCFGQGQVGGVLAKEVLGPGLEAEDAVAQGNLIAVQHEDLLLGEAALDLDREHDLFQLACGRALVG